MKKLFAIGLLATLALPGFAQNDLLVGKTVGTVGKALVWTNSDGQTTYEFKTDELSKIVADPTNTVNVYLFPEGGYKTEDNIQIGIQPFYVDMGSSQTVGSVMTTWEGAAADSFEIYITNEAPSEALFNGTPSYTVSGLGQYTDNTAVINGNATGRYLVFRATNATNYDWGVKIRSIKAYAPVASELTTFTVSPKIVATGKATPLTMSFKDQLGQELTDVTVALDGNNATFQNNVLTINSGSSATLKATRGSKSLTETVYAAVAPITPKSTDIKTPIYSNGNTSYNDDFKYEAGYNGGAKDNGEIQFPTGEVAHSFGQAACIFLYNPTSEDRAWNGNINPEEKEYRSFNIDIFSSKDDSTGRIEFESTEGDTQPTNNFDVKGGQWTTVTVDLSNTTKLNNISVRFATPTTAETAPDILLANIYFSPKAIEGDNTAPVITKLEQKSATPTTVTIGVTATDQNPTLTYVATLNGQEYPVSGDQGKENLITITGLQPWQSYTVSVIANDGNQSCTPQNLTINTTKLLAADVKGITLPATVQVTEGKSTTVSVQAYWGAEEPYEYFAPVMFSSVTLQSNEEGVKISGGTNGEFTIQGLTSGVYPLVAVAEDGVVNLTATSSLSVIPDWSKETDLSAGITPTGRWSSEAEASENTPAKANDGNNDTYYQYNGGYGGGEGWLIVDLGSLYAINAVGVYFPDKDGNTGKFQVSFGANNAVLPTGDVKWVSNEEKELYAGWEHSENIDKVKDGYATYLPSEVKVARYIAIRDTDNPNAKPCVGDIKVLGKKYENAVPTSVSLSADNDNIATDEKVNLTAFVLDNYGVVVPNQTITITANDVAVNGMEFAPTATGKYTLVAKSGNFASAPVVVNVVAAKENKLTKEHCSNVTLAGKVIETNPLSQELSFEDVNQPLVITFENPVDLDLLRIRWERAAPSSYTVSATYNYTDTKEIMKVVRSTENGVNPTDRIYSGEAGNGIATLNGIMASAPADLKGITELKILPLEKDHQWNIRLFGVDAFGTDEFMSSGIELLPNNLFTDTVDVVTLQGTVVKRGVSISKATDNLPAGLYIIGGKKVMVR